MNKKIFVTLLFLLGVGIFGSINHVNAASLTQNTATPYDVTAGSTVDYAISFKTATTIANTGKIVIQFPTGFDVSAATSTSWTGFDGGRTLSVATQTITITRDATGTSSTAGVKTIVLSNIVNSTTTANNYQVTVTTKTSANAIIDGPTSSIYFQIFATNTPTTIDGLYYLREDTQTHYQNNNSIATHFDLGTFSRTAPILNEERHCNDFVQFYFDENGTYTSTTTISNIYYHTWWISTDNSGLLGYNATGTSGVVMNESFTINSINSPNQINSYYLYAGQQTFVAPKNIFGNAIYNFSITNYSSTKKPQIISSPTQPSFVIINLPASSTIATLGISQDGDTDYDNDELTDYDELFIYYTNPYDSDTDDDGWNDKYEVDNSLNPNDPDSAPYFDEWFINKITGVSTDKFGDSVSSISDIDGDGLDDVLIGAYLASPGGLSAAGSVYLYSSGTGDLIKQFDGLAAGDKFGDSVSSISDIDGDGLDDVLIGAYLASPGGLSAAGSVYLYSSGTGDLIKQFDGLAARDGFGESVSSISDIDGDGLDDVIVGARNASPGGVYSAGSAYIYSSGTGNLIRQYNGSGMLDMLGMSVSSISDIDGDGLDDVIVGAILANSYTGSVYIYSSGIGNLIKQYNGSAVNNTFGISVDSISDIDGDGLDDVLVGASYAAPVSSVFNSGAAYIYSSGTGNLIRQYNGERTYEYFGDSVSSISDIDGDGLDDVLVGAPYASSGDFYMSGTAYIYSSVTGNLIKRYNGEALSSQFGTFISSISDLNGDGKEDVLVGTVTGVVYIYSSGAGDIPTQSWSKNTTKENFDLDNYFTELNNDTLPARNQTVIYTASTSDNPNIDISIASNGVVTFSQPTNWLGTETVRFTATDSTSLSSTSTLVTLMVTGAPNTPNSISLNNDTEFQITASWSTNLNLSTTTYYIENTTANTNSGWTSNTSWTSTGLSCGTIYSFQVKAKDGNGLISTSTPVSITTRGCVGGGSGLPVNAIDLTSTPTPTPTPSLSVIPTPTSTPTPTDPQSILNSLLQQLASLQQQLANQQTKYIFTHSLQHGDTGEDVTQLQTFLKSQGIDIYPEGLITGYFGNLTKLAVQRFQVKYNIAKSGDGGYGYVGPKTREKMNSL